MKSLPVFEADSHRRARRRRQRYRLALVCLAVLVAGATGYALIHPAITMTGTAHTHDASCYTQVVSKTEQVLSCTFAQAHAEDTARILHLHDRNCYDAAGMLVCPLEEAEAHTHTQACYETPEAHTHTEDCYERQQGELSCGEEETESHLHTDDCYAWTDVPVCGLDEGAAAEPVLSCEKPELVPHAHTEDCYNEDGTLRCELPQILTHQHGEECFAAVTVPADTQTLTCTNTDPEHIHDALCYGTWELTCGLTEGSAEPDDPETPPAEPEESDDLEEPETPEESEETEEEPEQSEEPAADTQEAADEEADEADVQTFRLGYYRICDGKPLLVKEETTERKAAAFGTKTRYYVTASELENVYGKFGFKSSSYSGKLIFPHTDSRSSDKLWADCAPERDEDSGEWRIPLSEQGQSDHSYVYYLPANDATTVLLSDTAALAANTFYTITVSAPEASGITQTGVYEVFTGESFEIKLPIVEGYVWKLTNLSTGMPLTPSSTEQQEQSVFYAFDAVACPIRIAAVKDGSEDRLACTIRYTANTLDSNLKDLSYAVPVSKQTVITDGTVGGLPSLDEPVDLSLTETYTLRKPDMDTLQAGEANNATQDKVFFYRFVGWRAKGSDAVFPAGTEIHVSDLAAYESVSDLLELEAVWTPFDAQETIPTVNFYVNLACEIMDSRDNGVQGNPTNRFTQSLFAAKVLGTDTNTKIKDLYAPVTSEGSDNAYDVDAQLRTLTQTACDDITLSDFPSDEEVFAAIRADVGYTIMIDGVEIPAQNLTTEYFKVRWYVLKYHDTDGWHIDGVLVAKQAKLRVTKSFLGDAEAINAVKEQTGDSAYQIKMSSVHPSGREWVDGDTYYLTLEPAEDVADESKFGYSSYDAATDTYTWIVTGRIDGKYTFTEENYKPTSGSEAQCAAYCRVSDDEWLTGSAVSDVFMEAYPEDQPAGTYKTVSFRNYYLQPKTLTIHKIDAFTSLPLANVTFTLSRADQTPLTLYRKPGTSMYSYMTSADYSEPVNDGKIVTDANGDLFLSLAAGSYVLAETFPTGYSGAARIEFTVDETCRITSSAVEPYFTIANGGASMMIRNQSELLTSVTAVKDWGSTPEDRCAPVVVKLLCNGAPLSGAEYTQTLNSGNDWTYEWHNLPLFTDGELAVYSLHEAMIGNTTYDKTADEDGYANYEVTYAPAQYSKDGVDCTANPYWTDKNGIVQYADHVLLTVYNRLDGNSGQIRVTKQFQNAAGAQVGQIEGTYTFGIYTAEYPDGARLATASIVYRNGTSDPSDDIVRFDGLAIGESYYVYELDSSGNPIAGGSTAVIGGKPFLVSGSGETVTVSKDAPTGAVTVTNCVAYPALPMTGGTGPEPFLLAGGLLSAGAAGALALRRRRKHLPQ